jgi:MFS transporter, DHA1 family, tetracycline resistance protein
VGLLFGVAGFAAFGLAATGAFFLAGIPLLALWGLASPASLGLMSRRIGASEQGILQGANASIMGIANLLGPSLFAQALAASVSSAGYLEGAAFLLAALLLVIAVAIALRATAAR